MPDAPIIRIEGASKRFGHVAAVDHISLEIRANELFALLGPSGCGKTTLLRLLAGLERASAGRILIDGEDMAGVPPHRRPVNMVFQSYAVFPHMSVAQNVAYGLKVSGVPRAEAALRVGQALAMVRLDGLEGAPAHQLSGGQLQRVALARALVKRPKVLLLDEPLSALDRKLREEMRLELVRLQHEVGITFVIVAHDQEEALSMADRIGVMDQGRLLQVASPQELYEAPNCRMVADFIGKMNLFCGRLVDAGAAALVVESELGELRFGRAGLDLPACGAAAAAEVGVAVRPEKIRLSHERPPMVAQDRPIALRGRVVQVAYLGDASLVYVETETGRRITCRRPNERRAASPPVAVGETCWVAWEPADCLLLTS
jgi:spermidine/putrescine ABC transporter ATP-binding subunit